MAHLRLSATETHEALDEIALKVAEGKKWLRMAMAMAMASNLVVGQIYD